ncbi:hypothetical protein ABC383_22825 [Noviherbaspirillum sp. 1P10PC]|uniref:hypothetical protein n=1 Tax=Noviherbaspirillum sp. 1P10PC TaxID=3132292 RepID=UPI0039A35954
MLTKEEKQLIILNHSSRELLQLMVAVKIELENQANPTAELEQLHSTFNLTWEAIERQIEYISKYLKVEEDVLQAYSKSKIQ